MSAAPGRLLDLASVNVFVFPVGPVPVDVFQRYCQLLQLTAGRMPVERLNACVLLRYGMQLSPPSHAPWFDFQIIGVMHCPSLMHKTSSTVSSLHADTYLPLVKRTTTALVQQCWVFDPDDTLADDVKGVTVIPNTHSDAKIAFYMHTLMADVLNDLLKRIADILAVAETRDKLIASPPLHMSTTSSISEQSPTDNAIFESSRAESSSSITSLSTVSVPIDIVTSSSLRSSSNRQSSGNNMNMHLSLPAYHRTSSLIGDDKAHSRNISSVSSVRNFGPNSANLADNEKEKEFSVAGLVQQTGTLTAFSEQLKEKRRIPGRLHKNSADWLLLSGNWQKALASYVTSIEMCRSCGDLMWAASASEGALCATYLIQVTAAKEDPSPETIFKLHTFLSSFNGRCEEILLLYEKSDASFLRVDAATRFAQFMVDWYLQEVVNIVSQSHNVYSHWPHYMDNIETLKDPLRTGELAAPENPNADEDATNQALDFKLPTKTLTNTSDGAIGNKETTLVDRKLAARYVGDIWQFGVDLLDADEQVRITSTLSVLYMRLNYRRKYAFYMRYMAMIQGRSILSTAKQTKSQLESEVFTSTPAVTRPLVSSIYRAYHVLHTLSLAMHYIAIGRTDITECRMISPLASMNFLSKEYPTTTALERNGRSGVSATLFPVANSYKMGWPSLYLNILREAIALADLVSDYSYLQKFCGMLLKALITEVSTVNSDVQTEQKLLIEFTRLLARKCQSLSYSSKNRLDANTIPVMHAENCEPLENWIHPFLESHINIIQNLSAHTASDEPPTTLALIRSATETVDVDSSANDDPFIYNPYAKKPVVLPTLPTVSSSLQYFIRHIWYRKSMTSGDMQVTTPINVTVGGKLSLKVMLHNPFTVDLVIDGISLIVSGTHMMDIHSDHTLPIVVPPECFHVHEIVVAFNEPGQIIFRACTVVFCGGWSETYDFGENDSVAMSSDKTGVPVHVLPSLPQLRLLSQSDSYDTIISLFDGESKILNLEYENIGSSKLSHFRISCLHACDGGKSKKLEKMLTFLNWTNSTGTHSFSTSSTWIDVCLMPYEKISMALQVIGCSDLTEGSIDIAYSCDHEIHSYMRFLSTPIRFVVRPLLYLCSTDIITSAHDIEAGSWAQIILDVRNLWAHSVEVAFNKLSIRCGMPFSQTIGARYTARLIMPLDPDIICNIEAEIGKLLTAMNTASTLTNGLYANTLQPNDIIRDLPCIPQRIDAQYAVQNIDTDQVLMPQSTNSGNYFGVANACASILRKSDPDILRRLVPYAVIPSGRWKYLRKSEIPFKAPFSTVYAATDWDALLDYISLFESSNMTGWVDKATTIASLLRRCEIQERMDRRLYWMKYVLFSAESNLVADWTVGGEGKKMGQTDFSNDVDITPAMLLNLEKVKESPTIEVISTDSTTTVQNTGRHCWSVKAGVGLSVQLKLALKSVHEDCIFICQPHGLQSVLEGCAASSGAAYTAHLLDTGMHRFTWSLETAQGTGDQLRVNSSGFVEIELII